MLSKKQAHDIKDNKDIVVHVDEWNEDVKIKSMSIKDRIEFERILNEGKEKVDSMVLMVMMTAVDEEGNRIWEDGDKENLESKSPNAILQLFEGSLKLNLLSKGVVEDKAKNS